MTNQLAPDNLDLNIVLQKEANLGAKKHQQPQQYSESKWIPT